MKAYKLKLILIIMVCVLSLGSIEQKGIEIKVSPQNFILVPEKFEEKCVVMEMMFRNFASKQDRAGFAKCTMEGINDSLKVEENRILFYNVYLDSDTVEKWYDKLFFGRRIIIHTYVEKVDGNWSRLVVYEIEELEEEKCKE